MYKRELDQKIRSNKIPKSIFLYGENFFSSSYGSYLASRCTSKDNMLSFYFEEYSYESAKNYISQPSLFGDISLLYIKGDHKIPKKELDILVSLCDKNSSSFFIYEFCGSDKVAKDMSRSFSKKKSADFVRFFRPSLSEAVASLSKKANQIGLEIDSFALQHLFLLQNEDLSIANRELEKLLLLDKKVTADDIDKHVYGMGEIRIDDFINDLLAKKDIRDELYKLLEVSSLDEILIINTLQNYIVSLFLFNSYIKIHGKYDVIAILGYPLPPNLVKERASLSIKINFETYQKLLNLLSECEFKLKKVPLIDKNSLLIATLIKLQTLL
jgi:DNA polymerase-3 subunit delta